MAPVQENFQQKRDGLRIGAVPGFAVRTAVVLRGSKTLRTAPDEPEDSPEITAILVKLAPFQHNQKTATEVNINQF